MPLADLVPDRPRLVEAEGACVVLVRVGDQVHALGEACAHKGGPLAEGKLSGTRLACPWHGWMYDVRTGQCVFPGRGAAVPSYPVRVEGDDVFVELA
jgi:nitrite reductase (NADH) small subunit/3-phenylpropionate/trans-cinnamate dioxygenase ferredoxin subunit